MSNESQGWARDFFGPLWSWLMIGLGFVLTILAYVLNVIGLSDSIVFSLFAVGVAIILAMLSYLVVQGRRTWRAVFWFLHLDDVDLLMGRKKDE